MIELAICIVLGYFGICGIIYIGCIVLTGIGRTIDYIEELFK